MASKVLKSFLIGIGYDTKALEVGDRKINASLQGIKSNTLGVSAALVGAFGAGAGVIASTANRIDRLAAATQNMRTPMNTVYNFGNAVEAMGGQASEALDALKRFEEFQNNFNLNGQDSSIDSLAKAGIDVGALASTRGGDAMDFARELERQYQGLNEGQRAQVQDALGLSNGVSRLLSEGKTEARMALSSSYTGPIDQMTESARRFAESNTILSQKFEGMANELTDKFLPKLIGASEWMGKFLDDHREQIGKTIDYAAEKPASAVLGASAGAVIGGSLLSYLGLSGLGKVATRAGMPGLIASGSYMATDSIFDKLESYEGYRGFSDSVDQGARNIGLGSLVDFSSWAFNKEVQPKISVSPSANTPYEQQSSANERSKETSSQSLGISDRWYKEVPSSQLDELVRAMQEARLNVKKHSPAIQSVFDDSSSGIVDRRESEAPPVHYHRYQIESIYGERSAADIMPPKESVDDSHKDSPTQSSDDLVRAIQRAKVNVNNNLTIQLDGRELDARIIQVNERQNYEAAEDFKPTTER